MNNSDASLEELRKEVDRVLSSLSPRESQAFRMMMNMKLINQTAEQQDSILRAMLDELNARK